MRRRLDQLVSLLSTAAGLLLLLALGLLCWLLWRLTSAREPLTARDGRGVSKNHDGRRPRRRADTDFGLAREAPSPCQE